MIANRWMILILIGLVALTACQPQGSPTSDGVAVVEGSPTPETLALTLTETPAAPSETLLPAEVATATEGAIATEGASPAPEMAAPPSPPVFPVGGVELHRGNANAGFDLIAATNTYWIRRNGVFWAAVEPQEGLRNWAALADLELEMQSISQNGMQLILIIRDTPEWARQVPDKACGPIKMEKLEAFGNFLYELVQRYSVPPYHVKYWELGNEPDAPYSLLNSNAPYGCWGEEQDPYYGGEYYAEMLKIAYPRIKAADPGAQVLVGGLLLDCNPLNPPLKPDGSGEISDCTASKYLEGILRNGGGSFFDGVSFHAYDYYSGQTLYSNPGWQSNSKTTGPALIAKANYLRILLAAYNQTDKFLINTETALICGRGGSEPHCQTAEFNQTKANFAAVSFAAAQASGLWGNVWYSVTGWRASGLIDKQSQPYPVYDAYAFSLEMLAEAAFVTEVSDYPDLMGYEFQRGDARFWIVWALEQPQTIQLPEAPDRAFDVFGNPLQASQQIEVTQNPIYIEWLP
jgi:hypothetical protein